MRQGLLPPLPVWEMGTSLGEDAVCTLRRIVGNRPICNRPAAWACRLGCCGNVKVVCASHRNIPEAVWPKQFICSACRAPNPGVIASWPV